MKVQRKTQERTENYIKSKKTGLLGIVQNRTTGHMLGTRKKS